MTTKKKSVFLEPKIKKIIELQMNLNNYSTRSKALESMLKESKRYLELKAKLELFNTESVTLSDSESPRENFKVPPSDNSEDFLDLTNKKVEDLLKRGEQNENI